MLHRVSGQAEFEQSLSGFQDCIERGQILSPEEIDLFLLTAKRVEQLASLKAMLDYGISRLGIQAATLLLYIPKNDLQSQAAEYLARAIKHSDSQALFAFRALASLQIMPRLVRKPILRALDSEDHELRIAAAGLIQKLKPASPAAIIKAIQILERYIDQQHPRWSRLATIEFVGFEIRVQKMLSIFRKWMSVAEDAEVFLGFQRLSSAYGAHPELVDLLKAVANDRSRPALLRAVGYYHTARICPSPENFKWLCRQFCSDKTIAKDPECVIAIGHGLKFFRMPIPKKVADSFISNLSEHDVSLRQVSAIALRVHAMSLEQEHFENLCRHLSVENDATTADHLHRCFMLGNAHGINPAFRQTMAASRVLKPIWTEILSWQLEKYPKEFLEIYSNFESDETAEFMPYVLSNIAITDDYILSIVRCGLESENELMRHHALIALRRSDSRAAIVSPALLLLYLRGNELEKQTAFSILMNIGNAAQPYIEAHQWQIKGETELREFQRVQRILGVAENAIRDIEFARIGKPEIIANFVQLAETMRENPTNGYRSNCLISGLQPNTSRFAIQKFENKLSDALQLEHPIVLARSSRGKSKYLTDEGIQWLERSKRYLEQIEYRWGD